MLTAFISIFKSGRLTSYALLYDLINRERLFRPVAMDQKDVVLYVRGALEEISLHILASNRCIALQLDIVVFVCSDHGSILRIVVYRTETSRLLLSLRSALGGS